MALTLQKLKKAAEMRNSRIDRGARKPHLLAILESAGIRPSDLGETFPLKDGERDGWFWQTPFGDLIEYADGHLRINDEGETGA